MQAGPGRNLDPRAALDAVGAMAEAEIDIAETALQFARIDRPEDDCDAARALLSAIARDAAAMAIDAPARGKALADLLAGRYGFSGDAADYDNPANANLIAVLQRRRGLPVALGILWLHAAAAAGWAAHGLDVPAHFLITLDAVPERGALPLVLDPFDSGTRLDSERLHTLLRRVAGPEAALRRVGPRAVLLRLQNNIRTRRLGAGDLAGALTASRDMLRIAPEHAALWQEAGALHQRLDQVGAALRCYDRCLALAPAGEAAARLKREIGRLRTRLN